MKLPETAAALAREAAKLPEGQKFEVAEAAKPQLPSTGPGAVDTRSKEEISRALWG